MLTQEEKIRQLALELVADEPLVMYLALPHSWFASSAAREGWHLEESFFEAQVITELAPLNVPASPIDVSLPDSLTFQWVKSPLYKLS